jgi:hypothetical protein
MQACMGRTLLCMKREERTKRPISADEATSVRLFGTVKRFAVGSLTMKSRRRWQVRGGPKDTRAADKNGEGVVVDGGRRLANGEDGGEGVEAGETEAERDRDLPSVFRGGGATTIWDSWGWIIETAGKDESTEGCTALRRHTRRGLVRAAEGDERVGLDEEGERKTEAEVEGEVAVLTHWRSATRNTGRRGRVGGSRRRCRCCCRDTPPVPSVPLGVDVVTDVISIVANKSTLSPFLARPVLTASTGAAGGF